MSRLLSLGVGVLLAAAGLGAVGLVLGGACAVALPAVIARAEPAELERTRRALRRELPASVDLLGAVLAAGADPRTALALTGRAVDGRLGTRLTAAARAQELGADAEHAWAPALLAGGEPLAPLAEAFLAAEVDGSGLLPRLDRLAAEAREIAAAAALTAAERAGVRAVAPLGLCFLPAFVAVGVVPVIASALRTVPW